MATAAKVTYPHIVKEPGYCGGKAAIDDTRVRVANVVYLHKQGKTPAQILEAYPDLSLAQVHAALAYYYDHPDEIEETLKAEEGWDERHERRKAEALGRRADKQWRTLRAYTDADVHGPLIKALRSAGWDILRAIDTFAERTSDLTHFEHAVALGRVLVTNDEDQEEIAARWYGQGRPFPGVIAWRQRVYGQMSYGEIVEYFEKLTQQDSPFAVYPILHVKPQR